MKKEFKNTEKKSNMLCGPACLDYLANHIYNLNISIPNNLFWIADLATFAKTILNFSSELSCYESRLYHDFLRSNPPYEFEGFSSLENYINMTSQKIYDKKYSISSIHELLDKNIFVLLNVSSAIFNDDLSMNGGHFILLLDYDDNYFKIANPTSNNIEIQDFSKEQIMNASQAFGNWILCLKSL